MGVKFPRQRGHGALEQTWRTLAHHPFAFALLAIIAGMAKVDTSTQYLFWDIFVEMPKNRSSLRGVTCTVVVEDKARRSDLHPEETPEGWNARFRMQRTAGHSILPEQVITQGLVEIMVNVNMITRPMGGSGMVHATTLVDIPMYVNACAHGWVHNPYDEPTGESMAKEGDEKGREINGAGARARLREIVQSIS